LIEVEEGRAVFEGNPDHRVYNPIGSVHGGYAATLLDSACGIAVHSKLAPGQGYTTLELKISYVRGMTVDTGVVRAEGIVISMGRRVAFAEAKLTDADGPYPRDGHLNLAGDLVMNMAADHRCHRLRRSSAVCGSAATR
jgi:uncharacterized protein (TIGR00369 family)